MLEWVSGEAVECWSKSKRSTESSCGPLLPWGHHGPWAPGPAGVLVWLSLAGLYLSPVMLCLVVSAALPDRDLDVGKMRLFFFNIIPLKWFLIEFVLASLMINFSASQLGETGLCSALLLSTPRKLQDLRCLWAELFPSSGIL